MDTGASLFLSRRSQPTWRADCTSPHNCATQLQQPLVAMHDGTSAGEQISLFSTMHSDRLSGSVNLKV